ncbi:MAG: hypothetical protein H0W34_15455 [Pyrinomonadaceae bacterium]|nr:hypothetical protein [Pyrinomonadaceae bacterium]
MAYEKELLSEGQLAKMLRADRVSTRALIEQVLHQFNEPMETGYQTFELDMTQSLAGR